MDLNEVEDFVSGLQLITEDHIKLMRPEKIEEIIAKAAHIIVELKVELERRLTSQFSMKEMENEIRIFVAEVLFGLRKDLIEGVNEHSVTKVNDAIISIIERHLTSRSGG